MPHSKFGWSYPPGCSGPPEPDYDDTRCCRCHRDLDDAWDEWAHENIPTYDKKPIDTGYEQSPMFSGFCCWACARDYADAEATKPYYAHEMPEREEYRRKAAGAQAPEILKEDSDEYFDGGYDPCDDPENPERIDRASGGRP